MFHRAIARQPSIIDQDSKPARREISPCGSGQPIRHAGKTENILGSPRGTLSSDSPAERERLISANSYASLLPH